jgi:N12 class adenine-specific DNA methylase
LLFDVEPPALDLVQQGQQGQQGQEEALPQNVPTAAVLPDGAEQAPPYQDDDFDLANEAIGTGGLGQKYRDNIAAIQILKTLASERRKATPDERKAIARYVGWGALKGVFDPENKQWGREYSQLKELLTESEWKAARASILNAHYTSPTVVTGIYRALEQMGFQSGRVLEPSAGVGNFFGLMPAGMRKGSELHGVELDPLTASIAAALYPSAKIAPKGFEDFSIPSEYFDLAVGNPPFGNTPLVDFDRSAYSGYSIHNYFFAKSIDKLRPGGMLAMVVSRYFMDAQNSLARKWISDRANLVSAVRLPNTAFKENAGTEVVTDIVVFQKRAADEAPGNTAWVNTASLNLDDPKTGEPLSFQINSYFLENPQNILGKQAAEGNLYRANDYTVLPETERTIEQALDAWAESLPEGVYQPIERTAELETADVRVPDGVKVGSFYVADNGNVMIRGDDKLGVQTADEWEAPNAKAVDRVKGMIALRDGLRQQMRLELSPEASGAQIEAGRAALNRRYDNFVKSYGYVNDATNMRLFYSDTEASLLGALEFGYDKGISEAIAKRDGIEPRKPSAKKADILLQRVLFPPGDNIRVESARDAMLASLNYRGCIDLPYMESVYLGKSQDEIVTELGDAVFDDPVDGLMLADEYLSGDVKTKLDNAKAAAKENSVYQRNVAALEKVIPADKRPSEISISLGAAFVPSEIYADFAEHVTGQRPEIGYIRSIGQWAIGNWRGAADPSLAIGKYGTERCPAVEIFRHTLDGRGVVVKDNLPGKPPRSVVNGEQTEAAREKQQAMKNEWQRWLWADPERADKVARLYNDKLNRTVPRKYDGAHLTLPGLSPVVSLREHQKNAVWRSLQSRQVLLDHAVGAGKTAVIVAVMMEMRRLGIARKPLIAVPNHLTLQWRDEFYKFFPASRVLAATPDDFAKGNREKFFAKVVTGDWDAVIVGHSSLKKIGLPHEMEEKVIRKQVDELADAIEEMKRGRHDSFIVRDMEKIKARLDAQFKEKQQSVGERDNLLTFDELGVDAFAIDELHEFKNLFYNSTMDRVPGMGNPHGSDKAFDLFVKTQWMWETFGDKAVLLGATGTPVSNSMVEMFNLQRYMQYPKLEEHDLQVFDSWARLFANVQSVYEVTPSGTGYRQSSRLEFTGVNALMPLYRSFADTVTLDDLQKQALERGDVFPVPKIEGGRAANIVAQRSPEVAAFIGFPQLAMADGQPIFGFNPKLGDTVQIEHVFNPVAKEFKWKAEVTSSADTESGEFTYELAEADTREDAELAVVQAALSPKIVVDPGSILGQFNQLRELMLSTKGKVNALSLTGLANKAGLDFRLIDPDAPDYPDSKINLAVGQMMRLYKKWDADKGTQMVFCDMSIPLSCRKALSSHDSRVYVRDPGTGDVVHKRGTLHTAEGFEEFPFLLVNERGLCTVYDAGSGVYVTGANTKADAKQEAEKHLRDGMLRGAWGERREAAGLIAQTEIDEYNAAHGYDENAEGAAITLGDVAAISGAQSFSVYDDIKNKLIAQGIPDNEIAFIHDYATPAAKDKLFKAVNRGDVRILMGSTAKMGAGTNVQTRLVGLHHIDAPWRPSDLEQREGRIIRQGNVLYKRDPEGFEVGIYRYATAQTYDTRRWQILEHKARMIAQLRNYDPSTGCGVEDIAPEAASAADMKAAASGDPLILEETRLKNEVIRLEKLQSAHADETNMLIHRVRAEEDFATRLAPARLGLLRDLQKKAESHPLQKNVFPGIELGGVRYAERENAVSAIQSEIVKVFSTSSTSTIKYRGVEFTLHGTTDPHGHSNGLELESPVHRMDTFYPKGTGLPSASGFITRFSNFVEKIPGYIDETETKMNRAACNAVSLREQAAKPFEKEGELDAARAAYRNVQRQLIAKGPEVPEHQKPILESALRSQREHLVALGFGRALDEFTGMRALDAQTGATALPPQEAARQEAAYRRGSQNEERHLHGIRNLMKYGQVLASDSRYAEHTGEELAKAAFYRGVYEKETLLTGKTPNLAAIDTALSNRATLSKLPIADDIKGIEIERGRGQGRAHGLGEWQGL